jgi:hypothetical protein
LAGRDPSEVWLSGGGFIITGPSESALQAGREEVRRRIAFYASTRTYTPVLECHGFQEVGQRLHEMSVQGQWGDMGRLVSDEMLDAFTTTGVYEQIADKVVYRYGGLVHEVNFPVVVASWTEERRLKKAIRQLQEHS